MVGWPTYKMVQDVFSKSTLTWHSGKKSYGWLKNAKVPCRKCISKIQYVSLPFHTVRFWKLTPFLSRKQRIIVQGSCWNSTLYLHCQSVNITSWAAFARWHYDVWCTRQRCPSGAWAASMWQGPSYGRRGEGRRLHWWSPQQSFANWDCVGMERSGGWGAPCTASLRAHQIGATTETVLSKVSGGWRMMKSMGWSLLENPICGASASTLWQYVFVEGKNWYSLRKLP